MLKCSLSISSFSLHFLFIFSFPLHFLTARLPGWHNLCNPVLYDTNFPWHTISHTCFHSQKFSDTSPTHPLIPLIVRGCFKDLLFPNITSPFAQIPLFPMSDDFCAAKCISTIIPTTAIKSTVCPFNWLQLVTVTFKVHNETLCWNA